MRIVNIKQGTPEWREFRNDKIGSSHASAIMGMNPWMSPLQCWESIISKESKEPNAAMIRGNQLEPVAREMVNADYASSLTSEKFQPIVAQHDTFDWMIASLDGWNGHSVLEIKCPGERDHADAKAGNIPEHYIPQLQHQLMVTGAKYGNYFSFDGKDGVMILFERDEVFISQLMEEEHAFYQSLLSFTPPEATDRDIVEITDPILLKQAENYRRLQEQIYLMQDDLENIRKDLIKGTSAPRAKIGSLKISKVIRKGAIDYASIPILQTMDLEVYRKKPVESWRITT
jgi:putative phage-type endonuclease